MAGLRRCPSLYCHPILPLVEHRVAHLLPLCLSALRGIAPVGVRQQLLEERIARELVPLVDHEGREGWTALFHLETARGTQHSRRVPPRD